MDFLNVSEHEAGVSKLWPTGQIWYTAYFCVAHQSIKNGYCRIVRIA